MIHKLLGEYRVNKTPYRIIFKDGVNYTRKESEIMSKLLDKEKLNVHNIKQVFGGEII